MYVDSLTVVSEAETYLAESKHTYYENCSNGYSSVISIDLDPEAGVYISENTKVSDIHYEFSSNGFENTLQIFLKLTTFLKDAEKEKIDKVVNVEYTTHRTSPIKKIFVLKTNNLLIRKKDRNILPPKEQKRVFLQIEKLLKTNANSVPITYFLQQEIIAIKVSLLVLALAYSNFYDDKKIVSFIKEKAECIDALSNQIQDMF